MKDALRAQMKRLLKAMSEEQRKVKGVKISKNLVKFLNENVSGLEILGGYAPIREEADWRSEFMNHKEIELAFPDLRSNEEMEFIVASPDELEVSKNFGVKVPTPKGHRKARPAVLVIPGLAFSKKGDRLGYGAGFYDKYLAKNMVLKVGVCFEEQLQNEIPSEAHDIKMDYIVTDEDIVKIKG